MDKTITQDPVERLNAKARLLDWPAHWDYAAIFDHAVLNELLAFWHRKAANGLPRRSDFSARQLKPVLPHISIMERAGTRYRIRLLGTAIAQSFGENTGRFLDEVIPAAMLSRWTDGYDLVLETARPLRVVGKFELPQVSFLYGETLAVPLADAEGRPVSVLSITYTTAKRVTGAL